MVRRVEGEGHHTHHGRHTKNEEKKVWKEIEIKKEMKEPTR